MYFVCTIKNIFACFFEGKLKVDQAYRMCNFRSDTVSKAQCFGYAF